MRERRKKKERLDYFPDSSKPESEDSHGSHDYSLGLGFLGYEAGGVWLVRGVIWVGLTDRQIGSYC